MNVLFVILAILYSLFFIFIIFLILRALFKPLFSFLIRHKFNKRYLDRSRARWLHSQLQDWVTAGIITKESSQKLRDLYYWPTMLISGAIKRISVIRILVMFGSLLVGTGIIFLISHNWAYISPWNKVLIILAGIALVHSLGIHLLRDERSRKFGHTIIFLGNIIYGGGIWLVAQIFHISAHFPTGVFLWGLGVMPFAIILRSKLNYFFALILFALWTFLESIYYTQTHLWFLPFLFCILIPAAYHIRTRAGLLFSYFIGYAWLLTNLYYWTGEEFSPFTLGPMLLYGLALYSLAVIHRYGERLRYYETAYYFLAVFLIFIACAAYTLLVFVEVGTLDLVKQTNLPYWIISAILAVPILCGIFYCLVRAKEHKELSSDGVFIASLSAAFVLFLFSGYFGSIAFVYFLPILLFCLCLYHIHKDGKILLALSTYFPIWLLFTFEGYNSISAISSMLLVYGGCVYAMSLVNDKRGRSGFAAADRILGLSVIFIVIYLHTIKDFTAEVTEAGALSCSKDFWLIYTALYCSMGVLIWRGALKPLGVGVLKWANLRELISFPMFLVPIFYLHYIDLAGIELPLTIASNILIFAYIIALLIISYRHDQIETKIFSIFAFFILVFTRYFDVGLSLVTRSILFILVGAVFICGSILLDKYKQRIRIKASYEE